MRTALLALTWMVPSLAMAQAEELENPGSIAAVQERLYRMNHELTLGVGSLPLDAFYKGFYGQVAYSYHFTDSFAWQVGRGAYTYNINTGLREQLERDFDVLPTAFDEVAWMAGSDLIWSPFYGKTAFLNRAVLHFQTYLIGGVTFFKFKRDAKDFRPAVNAGVGARLFQNRFISYRLDVTNNFVIQPARTTGAVANVLTIQLMAALNFGATE